MTDDHFDVFDICDGRHTYNMLREIDRRGGYMWQCTECGYMS